MATAQLEKTFVEDETADQLLMDESDGTRVYTERQLARKIRLEDRRIPEMDETAIPKLAADYLVRKQLAQMAHSATLSKAQAALLALAVEGWSPVDISRRFDIPYDEVLRRLRIIRKRLQSGGSPWDGLYEVYWQEVHRYVYRRRITSK